MPTSAKVKKSILEALPKTVNGSIYELGSGWGTLAFPLAERYPLFSVHAYESSTIPYYFCKVRQLINPTPNLHFHQEDFFNIPLIDASLVVCYLYPGAMQSLKAKFEAELPPDSLVISNTFAIPGWKPFQVLETSDLYKTKVYIYKKGML